MATITRTLTPDQEAAFTVELAARNERLPVPLTMDDLLQSIVDGAIADLVNSATQRTTNLRAAKFASATKTDQAAVDAILAKY